MVETPAIPRRGWDAVGDQGMILVFGKTGQVATELARLSDVVCLSRAEADLENPASCADAIHEHAPSAVINAAAYTAVDQAESDAARAMTINAAAPRTMAQACHERGIPFVTISTDYVFDGSGTTPWPPDAATAPLGVYGTTKRQGEIDVLAVNPAAVILRTSWVFSPHGTNFVKTMLRLGRDRDALSIVADQWGGPTPARAIAEACHQIATAKAQGTAHGSGIYQFAGAPDTNWADFARAIFDIAGFGPTVTDIPTSAYPTPARRPLNSRMDCSTVLSDFGIARPAWRDHLAQVIAEVTQSQG